MISPTARANSPACSGLFPGVFGGVPDVSQKPNKINTQSEHNTFLSDVITRAARAAATSENAQCVKLGRAGERATAN